MTDPVERLAKEIESFYNRNLMKDIRDKGLAICLNESGYIHKSDAVNYVELCQRCHGADVTGYCPDCHGLGIVNKEV